MKTILTSNNIDWEYSDSMMKAIGSIPKEKATIAKLEKAARLAYVEAQIHGQVNPQDISAIYVAKYDQNNITDSVKQLAKDLGITIHYLQ